jgi:hypothetical protein
MIVFDGGRPILELRPVHAFGRGPDDVRQPRRGIRLAQDVQVAIANHVHQDERADLAQ